MIEKRFEIPEIFTKKISQNNRPSFDVIRASVNLMVAGILISFATSYKLPLSTTYVTFMVAMGTSLSDRAWGSESAVYRVAGVLNVIAGWFVLDRPTGRRSRSIRNQPPRHLEDAAGRGAIG